MTIARNEGCLVEVKWIDDKREPKCPPNPRYPRGIDVVAFPAKSAHKTRKVDLPYPAKRCGWYLVKCLRCQQQTMISTAGRVDDPRSVTIECKQ